MRFISMIGKLKNVLWSLLVLNIAGCGSLITTMENTNSVPLTSFSPEAEATLTVKYCGIYQGVQADIDELSLDKPASMVFLLDVPFSFVAGTIALPYTITTFGDCNKKYIYSCDELSEEYTRPECKIQNK